MPSTAKNTSLNYNPFGSAIESRAFASGEYRFGMNGQEKDDEFAGTYSAEFWQYESRLGRRWNLDQLGKPTMTHYSCFANSPIFYNDPLGLTETPTITTTKEVVVTAREDKNNFTHVTMKTVTQQTTTYKDGRKIVTTTTIVTENIVNNEPETINGANNPYYKTPTISNVALVITEQQSFNSNGELMGQWNYASEKKRDEINEDFTLLNDWTQSVIDYVNTRPTNSSTTYLNNHYKNGSNALKIAAIGGSIPFIVAGAGYLSKIDKIIASGLAPSVKARQLLNLVGGVPTVVGLSAAGSALIFGLMTPGSQTTVLTSGKANNGGVYKWPHNPRKPFLNPTNKQQIMDRSKLYKKLLIDATR